MRPSDVGARRDCGGLSSSNRQKTAHARKRVARLVAALALTATLIEGVPGRAADDTVLRHVSGSVAYRAADSGQPIAVTGSQVIGDQALAITGRASQGLLALPDSSLVGLGANTNVQVAAFKRAETGDGTTITVPTSGGTIRFQINHPQGGKSNYTFITPVATMSVRGTVGLLAHGPNGDIIACLECTPGDVSVTVGSQRLELLTGQTLVITLAGVVTVGVITAAILQSFSAAGLSTSAAATAPVAGGTSAGAAGGSAAAAGAVAAAAAASVLGNHAAVPAPSPTGSAQLQGIGRERRR